MFFKTPRQMTTNYLLTKYLTNSSFEANLEVIKNECINDLFSILRLKFLLKKNNITNNGFT